MGNTIKPEPKPNSIKSNYIADIYAGVSPILEKKSKEYVKSELKKKYSNLQGKKNTGTDAKGKSKSGVDASIFRMAEERDY